MFLFNLFYTKDLSSGVEVATKFEQLGFLFLFNPVILLLQCMFSFMFSQFVYIRIYVYIYIFGGSVGNITSKKYLCKTVIFLCTVYVFFYFLSICVHDVNVFFFWGEHCKKHTPQIVIFLFTGYFFFDDLWLCVHDVFFFFCCVCGCTVLGIDPLTCIEIAIKCVTVHFVQCIHIFYIEFVHIFYILSVFCTFFVGFFSIWGGCGRVVLGREFTISELYHIWMRQTFVIQKSLYINRSKCLPHSYVIEMSCITYE